MASRPTSVSLAPVQQLLADTNALGYDFPRTSHTEDLMQSSQWMLQVQYSINVTNTGSKDADDVVLGFLTPPGAGQNGVPLKVLFGFERVHVKAGETKTVYLYPSLTDFAQASSDGKLRLAAGEYGVHFGVQETHQHGMGYVEAESLAAMDPQSITKVLV